MFLLLSLAALVLGAGLSIQAGINNSLRAILGHPLHATITNFLVGIVAVFAVALAAGLRTPTAAQFGRTSWWMYLGGIVGGIYVWGSVALAPRLGATTLMVLVVTGQLGAAMVIDHFGLLGFTAQSATPTRLAGVALLVAGVILVRRG